MNGLWLVALILAAALYGVVSGQTLTYLRRDCHDRLRLKIMVIVIWSLESLHIFFSTCSAWDYVIINHANAASGFLFWNVPAGMIVMNLSIAMVQYIWVMRIRQLNTSRYRSLIAAWMLVLIAMFTAFSLGWAALLFAAIGNPTSPQQMASNHPTIPSWVPPTVLILQIVNDVLATSMLSATLHPNKTGFRRSDALITRTLVFSLNTGFLTCISGIAVLVTWLVIPDQTYCEAVWLATAKVYSISLLAMLNWRPSNEVTTEQSNECPFELTTIAQEMSMQWDNGISGGTSHMDTGPTTIEGLI
ncbi:hypothetical protein FIBSPDRAFT_1049230 [Athelia psychrophila]|uniref:DUF6534 domain-containing protein n=1 Tax=Athelia psychrophila TaxID=1759441 RepID=A0A166CJE5_9AGAM|nr:hypothetical protein FIBSPDRAFT_1049230 [Fibularhizoctonia sp. CBS 109695]